MKITNIINILAITLILIGTFSIISETFFGYLLFVMQQPLVLPIFFLIIGFIIFGLNYTLNSGIHIDTFDKYQYEIDKEMIDKLNDKGYSVRKNF